MRKINSVKSRNQQSVMIFKADNFAHREDCIQCSE